MRVGYIRVSSSDQNTVRQLDGVAVDKTFTDRASGKDTDRDQFTAMCEFVREGDTIVVHSMDRLARNLDDLRRTVNTLTGRGVRVEFVKEVLTFTGEDSPMSQLMLSVMGAVAEFERALIRERQREGIAKAKQRGVYTGRKPALTAEQAYELRARAAAGESKTSLAKVFRISRDTVYAYLQAGLALPEDSRPLPDVAVYDRLLTRTTDAPAPAEDRDTERVVAESAPAPQPTPPGTPRRTRKPRPTRRRAEPSAGVPVGELVNIDRDPAGGYRVSDPDGYLGKVERQVKVSGGRGRWQARDATGHVITDRGPWNTKDDAVVRLLLDHMDRHDRRSRRL
jgi:DNA invertase Pin-like site-specific DNA recombinase